MADDDSTSIERRGAPNESAATELRRDSKASPKTGAALGRHGSDPGRSELDAYSMKILDELRSLNAYLEARL